MKPFIDNLIENNYTSYSISRIDGYELRNILYHVDSCIGYYEDDQFVVLCLKRSHNSVKIQHKLIAKTEHEFRQWLMNCGDYMFNDGELPTRPRMTEQLADYARQHNLRDARGNRYNTERQ